MDLNYPPVESVWSLPARAHIFRDVLDVPNAVVARDVAIPMQAHWFAGDDQGLYRLVDASFELEETDRLASTFRRLREHPDHHKRRFVSVVRENDEVYLVLVDDEANICARYEKE